MKKIISRIVPIFLSLILVFGSTMTVFASNYGGCGAARTENGVVKFYHRDGSEVPASSYTKAQNYFKKLIEKQLSELNIGSWLFGIIPSGQLEAAFQDSAFLSDYENKYGLNNLDGWQEYCHDTVLYDEDADEIQFAPKFCDDLYPYIKDFLDASTPFYNFKSVSYTLLDASSFETKTQFTSYKNLLANSSSDTLIYLFSGCSYTTSIDSFTHFTSDYITLSSNDDLIVGDRYNFSGSSRTIQPLRFYDKEWVQYTINKKYIDFQGNVCTSNKLVTESGSTMLYDSNYSYPLKSYIILSKDGRSVRIFKSLNDAKNYNVGQQPYYTTSKWSNYVPGNGNTITQQEFNAPVTYETIVNNISGDTTINNGISPEQLQQIIDAIIEAMKNNGGGGSGGGDGGGDDSGGGSSGGGLTALLAGLGKLGDVILSIVGKIIEYVGKLLDLLTTALTGVADKIPKGVTSFFSAVFPFFPQEWFDVIGIGLTLMVILGIVRMIRK